MRTQINQAGKFPVKQVPCPHFSQIVNMSLPRTGVLHTTEGSNVAGAMGVFKAHFAPHFVVGPESAKNKQVVIYQLVPVGVIGAACRAHNDMAIVQVEVCGFSKDKPWQFDKPTMDAFCSLLNVCRDEWGIPLSHPWADGDFGRAGRNPHRTSGRFGHVAGWFGHGDVPDPDVHWDPGCLKWTELWARCHELDTAHAIAA